ncbi:MAG: restriction endonuclease [Chthoniobacter sp.]|uniref:restriction endonuclease n=1 Tax=Chthoniobacter sp. TaxID=2510640 RepID=UPI0032A54FE9
MAKLLYSFLPGSGSSSWKGHVTFASVAHQAGVGDFWLGGGKEPAIARLIETTLERRRDRFESLVLGIVREGLKYRQKQNDPIKAGEIVSLNEVIQKIGFKFPSLWASDFLDSLASSATSTTAPVAEKQEAEEKRRRNQESARQRELDQLRAEFYALATAKDRQKAGFAFEGVLTRLFALFGLKPRLSYRVQGEQIDGSIELDSEIYLVEAKWEAAPMSEGPMLIFRGKVEGKSSFTRGIFIAANGFSPDALAAITRGKQPNFFLIDGYDLSLVIEGRVELDVILRHKHRVLAEEGTVLARHTLS